MRWFKGLTELREHTTLLFTCSFRHLLMTLITVHICRWSAKVRDNAFKIFIRCKVFGLFEDRTLATASYGASLMHIMAQKLHSHNSLDGLKWKI